MYVIQRLDTNAYLYDARPFHPMWTQIFTLAVRFGTDDAAVRHARFIKTRSPLTLAVRAYDDLRLPLAFADDPRGIA